MPVSWRIAHARQNSASMLETGFSSLPQTGEREAGHRGQALFRGVLWLGRFVHRCRLALLWLNVHNFHIEMQRLASERMVEIEQHGLIFHFHHHRKHRPAIGERALQTGPNFQSVRRYQVFLDFLPGLRVDIAIAISGRHNHFFRITDFQTGQRFLEPGNNLLGAVGIRERVAPDVLFKHRGIVFELERIFQRYQFSLRDGQ